MEAAVRAGTSWGFYCQGYGSGYKDRMDWRKPRESDYESLSGYQTLPINWGINTKIKDDFFKALAEITGSNIEWYLTIKYCLTLNAERHLPNDFTLLLK